MLQVFWKSAVLLSLWADVGYIQYGDVTCSYFHHRDESVCSTMMTELIKLKQINTSNRIYLLSAVNNYLKVFFVFGNDLFVLPHTAGMYLSHPCCLHCLPTAVLSWQHNSYWHMRQTWCACEGCCAPTFVQHSSEYILVLHLLFRSHTGDLVPEGLEKGILSWHIF